MLILGLLGMYFDAAVVFFTMASLFFSMAMAVLWGKKCGGSAWPPQPPQLRRPCVSYLCLNHLDWAISLTKWFFPLGRRFSLGA